MLKTIKTTKYLNLHELIKYVWENHEKIFEHTSLRTFESNNNATVLFTNTGHFETTHTHYPSDIFPVEIEEEITEETVFDRLVELYRDAHDKKFRTVNYFKENINYVKDDDTVFIYALIDNKLELIWERDNQ